MKHFTSYYANFGNIPKDYMCIGISRTCPEWFKDKNISNFMFIRDNVLAPSESILYSYKNGTITEEEYKKQYITDVLSKVQNELKELSIPSWISKMDVHFATEFDTKYQGIVFMCYEKPSDFCHRHLFRRMLTNVYGIPCEEFGCKPQEVWGYKPEHQYSKELFE